MRTGLWRQICASFGLTFKRPPSRTLLRVTEPGYVNRVLAT